MSASRTCLQSLNALSKRSAFAAPRAAYFHSTRPRHAEVVNHYDVLGVKSDASQGHTKKYSPDCYSSVMLPLTDLSLPFNKDNSTPSPKPIIQTTIPPTPPPQSGSSRYPPPTQSSVIPKTALGTTVTTSLLSPPAAATAAGLATRTPTPPPPHPLPSALVPPAV